MKVNSVFLLITLFGKENQLLNKVNYGYAWIIFINFSNYTEY